jgi:hypothetical protein
VCHGCYGHSTTTPGGAWPPTCLDPCSDGREPLNRSVMGVSGKKYGYRW